MPQVCTICRHEKRSEIDEALLAGAAYRTIASRFAASPAAVFRHGKDHLPKALVRAKEAAEDVQAETLFERLRSLNRDTAEILREARGSQNHALALQAIGRIEKQIELEARLLGEMDTSTKLAVGITLGGGAGVAGAAFSTLLKGMSDEEIQQLIEDYESGSLALPFAKT